MASVLQLLGFSLLLTGELHRKTCRSVGRVLRLCGSDVDLVLTPRKMSVRGASLLFSCTTQLHSLRFTFISLPLLFNTISSSLDVQLVLNVFYITAALSLFSRLSSDMALLLCRWVRRGRAACPLAVEELSLAPQKARPSDRVLLKVVSSLASLLRSWAVRRLDLTEFCVPAQGLIPLLLHDGPLTIK